MTIIDRISPNRGARPRGIPISAIVVHNTGARTADSTISWFLNPRSQVSSHVVIDVAGNIFRCVPDEMRAWHAGESQLFGQPDVNDFSLGAELVAIDGDEYSHEQFNALVEWTALAVSRYVIPLNRIVGHVHVSPGRKVDPGPTFPWFRYLVSVAKRVNL